MPAEEHEQPLMVDHDDRRSQVRSSVALDGHIRNGIGSSRSVVVKDLSLGGCQFKTALRLERGAFLTIRVGQIGPLDARVKWQFDERCGVSFERSLYPPVLDHILERCTPAPGELDTVEPAQSDHASEAPSPGR